MKSEKTKKAYQEILEILKKHKDNIALDVGDIESQAKQHLFGLKLKERYGLNIEPTDVESLDWIRKGDYLNISWWGETYNREIAWEDAKKQPKDELLLQISFPTGAYIFGDDYPTDFFKKFWTELKGYKPKYCDTTNKALYFSMDNAGKVFTDFKKRTIAKLEDELIKLKS